MRKFGTIIVDPPWPYARASKNERMTGFASQQYDTLSLGDLAALPVGEVAAKDSVLLLWTTPAFCATGADRHLCLEWGFRPVTYTYWVKTNRSGGLHHGVGYWFLGAVEPVLVGTRGKAYRTKEKGAFMSPVLGHSRKPDMLHEIAERHFPAPRLELFARRPRPGWTTTGLELDGKDVRDALKGLK